MSFKFHKSHYVHKTKLKYDGRYNFVYMDFLGYTNRVYDRSLPGFGIPECFGLGLSGFIKATTSVHKT